MTAFSLVLLNPFIDHRIVIELLIDSLPIDPLNGLNVDPLTHGLDMFMYNIHSTFILRRL
jgi:hypothetical protein